jgi:hypothetical protein
MTDQTESPVQALDSLAYEKLEKSAGLSAHRAKAISLPDCPIKASAAVLRFVTSGSTSMDVSAAVESMTARVDALQSITGDALEKELLGHCCTLDGLFQRWVYASVAATDADHRIKFAKLGSMSFRVEPNNLIWRPPG